MTDRNSKGRTVMANAVREFIRDKDISDLYDDKLLKEMEAYYHVQLIKPTKPLTNE